MTETRQEQKLLPIILFNVILTIILFVVMSLLDEYVFISSILSLIITTAFNFSLCYGLINNKSNSLGELFSNFKFIGTRIIIINLILIIIKVLIETIFGGISILNLAGSLTHGTGGMHTLSTIGGMVILSLIISFIFYLFTIYANFYLAETNEKELNLAYDIKNIFAIGKNKLSLTINSILKYVVLPAIICIVAISLVFYLTSNILSNSFGAIMGLLIVSVLLVAVVSAVFRAKLIISYSNNYIK